MKLTVMLLECSFSKLCSTGIACPRDVLERKTGVPLFSLLLFFFFPSSLSNTSCSPHFSPSLHNLLFLSSLHGIYCLMQCWYVSLHRTLGFIHKKMSISALYRNVNILCRSCVCRFTATYTKTFSKNAFLFEHL